MKQILVTGGTGTLGKAIVNLLVSKGYQPTILSSRIDSTKPSGINILKADLTDRSSLSKAIKEADIIVHGASNPRDSANVDVQGTQNLLQVINNKSAHILYLSIVGVDKSFYPYYRNKYQVEKMIQQSKFPWSVLRVTQFHDFVLHRIIRPLEQEMDAVVKIPTDMKFQSIAIEDVAQQVLHIAENKPTRAVLSLGGPQILSLKEMMRNYLDLIGSARAMEECVMENDFYNLFKTGINLCPGDSFGKITWSDFIKNTVHNQ